MRPEESPAETITRLIASYDAANDEQILERIEAIPPLADESDSCWDDDTYWHAAAYPYLALARVASRRRLRPAVRPLLDRAAFGDPGEIMRGLRHALEAIYAEDPRGLAGEYLAVADSPRMGTRMWALDGLAVLNDPRAKPAFERAIRTGPPPIRSIASLGMKRLEGPESLAAEEQRWKAELAAAREARLTEQIASDAAITDRRCAHCGNPLPSYRRTCKYCNAPAKAAE